MKLIKLTQKLKLDLTIEFQQFLPVGGRITEPFKQFHAQKGGTKLIASYLVILSRLKMSPYKGEVPVLFVTPSGFSYKLPLRVNMKT